MKLISTLFALGTLALCGQQAHAAELTTGPHTYVGVDLGRTSFKVGNLGGTKTMSDESAQAARFYGGYRFTENFGLEGGYVRLGGPAETVTLGNTPHRQDARARSFYGAVTGRVPVSESFALTGKAGLSFSRVNTSGDSTAASDMGGNARSLLVGVGAEYRLNQNVGLTLTYDRFGKLSDKVTGASMVSMGVNYRF